MNKYIFLDFDGVLNTENYQTKLQSEGSPGWDDFGMFFDPEAVANLKRITINPRTGVARRPMLRRQLII